MPKIETKILTGNISESCKGFQNNRKEVVGIILAAGKSVRMGTPKQLLPWAEGTVLEQVINQASQSILNHLLLVLGHNSDQIISKLDLKDVQVVINPNYVQGQSTSIQAGIKQLPAKFEAAIFLLADQPLISFSILNSIVDSYHQDSHPLIIPVYHGQRGNPVLIDQALFPKLMDLQGDIGARAIFDECSDLIFELNTSDQGICLDIDTWAEYQQLLYLSQKIK